jgi:2-dehydro-3-deoxygluconokinase
MRIKQIAIIGEAMLELSHINESTLHLSFAGDTLNFATYLRRILPKKCFDIHYVSAIGCDSYSDCMLESWQREGINTDLIMRVRDKLPGLYLIRTDEKGERTFYFFRKDSAARELFKTKGHNHLIQRLLTMDYLYFSGISLAILDNKSRKIFCSLLEKAKHKGIKIIFDTNYRASLWASPEIARSAIEQALKWVDIALPTFIDEKKLFGDITPDECGQRLLKSGITEVVVKCGSESALFVNMKQQVRIPALTVEKIVDTTGAGDSFNAAYVAARLLGLDPITAAQKGHQLAAVVIAHSGAIIPLNAMPSFDFKKLC